MHGSSGKAPAHQVQAPELGTIKTVNKQEIPAKEVNDLYNEKL
jgi:hypothetical protein